MMQNVYDNETFFTSYKQLRETDCNYNVLLEQPAMKELLPDLNGKAVLDLGCGFGINCMDFVNLGASSVVGVDISKRMLDYAQKNNSDNKIKYVNMSLENLSELYGTYDLIYSSLCFHYVKDFEKLFYDVSNHLNENGSLLFSVDHPIITCSDSDAGRDLRKLNGKPYAYAINNYCNEKDKRVRKWFVDGFYEYHHSFSTIINALSDAGLIIKKVVEPTPDDYALSKRPGLCKIFDRPAFLIIKAGKGSF